MEAVFDLCVVFLVWLGNLTGTTYKEINVILFCVIWPSATVWMITKIILQRRTIREYDSLLDDLLHDTINNNNDNKEGLSRLWDDIKDLEEEGNGSNRSKTRG